MVYKIIDSKNVLILLVCFSLCGCRTAEAIKSMRPNAEFKETEDGFKIYASQPGDARYKKLADGTVEVSYNTLQPSMLRTLTEAAVVKAMEKHSD